MSLSRASYSTNSQFRMRLLQELQELDLGDQQGQDLQELNQDGGWGLTCAEEEYDVEPAELEEALL